jgi:hypothetical protein
MAVTISLYNHTTRLFASGSNAAADTYKVALYTAATFSATDTTLAGITATEVANGSGYATGGETLTNVAVNTVTTNDASFDADDVVWTASGADLTAGFAVLYNDTDSGKPPLAFIDFGGSQTAGDTTDFKIIWNASGIFTFTTT